MHGRFCEDTKGRINQQERVSDSGDSGRFFVGMTDVAIA
jgi:hypothetical protein